MPIQRQPSSKKRGAAKSTNQHILEVSETANNNNPLVNNHNGKSPCGEENNGSKSNSIPRRRQREARFHKSDDASLHSNHVLEYLEKATTERSTDNNGSNALLTELSCEEILSDQSVEDIVNLFQRNHRYSHLAVLRLPRNQLTPAAAGPLANILQFTETLTHLDIRSNRLAEGVETLVQPLIERGEESSLVNLNLSDNNLGPKAAISVAQLLRLNKTITNIDLGKNQLKSKGMKTIAKGLETNTTLETLILAHNQGSTGTQYILKSLQENPDTQVSSLDISANKLGGTGAGIKAVRELLIRNKTIRILDLSSNNLKTVGALEFAPSLKLPNMLLDLNLSQNEIGNDGVIAIANSLQEDDMEHGHCYLDRLSLEWSQITDSGAIHLGKALEKNTKLTYLNLAHNHIGSLGAIQMAKTFTINFTLEEVLLHDNNVDDEGADALSRALGPKNCHIEAFTWHDNHLLTAKGEFKLSHVFEYRQSLKTWLNDLEHDLKQDQVMSVNWWTQPDPTIITDLEVMFLAQSLGRYKPERLQSIYLTGEHISDESIMQLCRQYLAENPSLQRLYIKNISMGSDGLNAIAQALNTNSTLRVLSITSCGVTALAGAGVLAFSLKQNSTIQRLNLHGNDIGDEGFRIIWDVIRRPHPSVISLNVSNNNLTDASMVHLYGSIEGLEELYLDGNKITDRGALDLAKAIMDRETLKILSIGNNALMTHRGKNTLRFFAPNRFSG